MKTEKRRKVIHYKRAVINGAVLTLQELIDDVLGDDKKASKAKNRREFFNADDESCRLINKHKKYNGMTFGQLVFFESGKSQTLITLNDSKEFFEIDSITTDSIKATTKKAKKEKREFIDSILYFGVLDNNLVILQSAALKARELESHLSWLLGTCTTVLDKNTALILQDKPTEETIKKIEKSPAKSVHIGTPIQSQVEQDDTVDAKNKVGKTKAKKVKFIPSGMGADVIKAALGVDWFNSLKLDDTLDEANLQVSLEVTYLRKTNKTGQNLLDNIATTLRHIDEADVKIDLNDGGTIKGKDLKLSASVSVNMINGLVDESDLYHQMHTWIVTKISSNELESEEILED